MLRAKNSWYRFKTSTKRLEINVVFETADVKYDEIKELIELSKNLVNSFSYAEDRSSFVDNLDSQQDTYRLLEKLTC